MKFLVLILIFSSQCLWAQDCAQTLKLVYKKQILAPITAAPELTMTIEDKTLVAHFRIQMDPSLINAHPLLPGEYPYQFDVGEIFISPFGPRNIYPYYEFEIGPYDDAFQVKISLKNGKKIFTNGVEMGLEHEAQITPDGWEGTLRIPLDKLGWSGGEIWGNGFSVLGKGPTRSYWSLSTPSQLKPNFHLPEFFRPLRLCPQ